MNRLLRPTIVAALVAGGVAFDVLAHQRSRVLGGEVVQIRPDRTGLGWGGRSRLAPWLSAQCMYVRRLRVAQCLSLMLQNILDIG